MKVKSLKQLIKDIDVQNIVGDITKSISDVTCDSRTVKEGSLFVAVRGVSVDAHQFLPQVAQAGAAAVVCEEIPLRWLIWRVSGMTTPRQNSSSWELPELMVRPQPQHCSMSWPT